MPLTKNLPREIRIGFVRKVYSILTVQLMVTVAIAAPIAMQSFKWVQAHAWISLVAMCLYLVVACGMVCARSLMRTFPFNYIMLFTLTGALSIMVGFSSAAYTWQSVLLAAGLTTCVVAALTIYAWTTKTDFTGFGPYLMMALFTLIVFGIAISIMSMFGLNFKPLMLLYDALGVLLFSGYLIYDTQLVIGEMGGHQVEFSIDDYCMAAIQLYLDIINLFILILQLLGERRDSS